MCLAGEDFGNGLLLKLEPFLVVDQIGKDDDFGGGVFHRDGEREVRASSGSPGWGRGSTGIPGGGFDAAHEASRAAMRDRNKHFISCENLFRTKDVKDRTGLSYGGRWLSTHDLRGLGRCVGESKSRCDRTMVRSGHQVPGWRRCRAGLRVPRPGHWVLEKKRR